MNLLRTGVLSAIPVVVRTLTSLILNKILAVHVGPAGYALIGQFQNFITMLSTLASGAFNTGVTKYTAEHFDDRRKQLRIWKSAVTIGLTCSFGASLIIILFREKLARQILHDVSYSSAFLSLGIGLVFMTMNGILISILNGKKEIERFVAVNVTGSLVSLVITGGLAYFYGISGALIALALNQSLVFFVTALMCISSDWFSFPDLFGKVDRASAYALGKFTLMAVASATFMPLSQMMIRSQLVENFGWDSAGQWDALLRISSLYLTLCSTPLAVYYLPRLSELRNVAEIRSEVIRGFKIFIPVSILGALALFLFRDKVILTVFDAKFLPMRELFAWQMAGDVIKTGCWLLGYVFLSKAMVKELVITELVFSVSWVISSKVLSSIYGLPGAQMGYFISMLMYFILMIFMIGRGLKRYM